MQPIVSSASLWRWKWLSTAEDICLLAATLIVGLRYSFALWFEAQLNAIAGLDAQWLFTFGAVCTIYIVAKVIRARHAMKDGGH